MDDKTLEPLKTTTDGFSPGKTLRLMLETDDLPSIVTTMRLMSLLCLLARLHGDDLPALRLSHVQSGILDFDYNPSDKELIGLIKDTIVDINTLKIPSKLEEHHYILHKSRQLFKILKMNGLEDIEYSLLRYEQIEDVPQLVECLFREALKIKGLDGNAFETGNEFTCREEVLQAYKLNKTQDLMSAMAKGIELNNISLNEANLSNACFKRCNFMKSTLENGMMDGADFSESNLIGASFEATSLRESTLNAAQMIECNLSEAILEDAILDHACMIGAFLRRANLQRASLKNTVLTRADLFHANFSHANLEHSNIAGANAISTNFSHANMTQCDFTAVNLMGINLNHANLTHAKLLEVNLGNLGEFEGANFTDADWWNAAKIAPGLLHYLHINYPCTLDAEMRAEQYKEKYGKRQPDEIAERQKAYIEIEELTF